MLKFSIDVIGTIHCIGRTATHSWVGQGVLIGIALVGVGFGWLISAGVQAALKAEQPELSGGRVIDFGHVNLTRELGSTFRLLNSGGAPVTVTKITSDCACTVIERSATVVGINNELTIPFRYTPDERIGPHESRIYVLSEELPPIILVARAYVQAGYPEKLDFGRVEPGIGTDKIIPIHGTGGVPFQIQHMNYDQERFEVTFLDGVDVSGAKRIRVRLKETAPVGEFLSTLRLSTDDKFMLVKEIQVAGKVLPWVHTVPEMIEWNIDTKETDAPLRLNLVGDRCSPLIVHAVYFEGDPLEFQMASGSAQGEVFLDFPRLAAMLSGPLDRGVLTIAGNCGEVAFDREVEFFAIRSPRN